MLIVTWHFGINSHWNTVRSNLQREEVYTCLKASLRQCNFPWSFRAKTSICISKLGHCSRLFWTCFTQLCWQHGKKMPDLSSYRNLIILCFTVFPHTVWTVQRRPVHVFPGKKDYFEIYKAIFHRYLRHQIVPTESHVPKFIRNIVKPTRNRKYA